MTEDIGMRTLDLLTRVFVVIGLILAMIVCGLLMVVAIPFELILWLGNRVTTDPQALPQPSPE